MLGIGVGHPLEHAGLAQPALLLDATIRHIRELFAHAQVDLLENQVALGQRLDIAAPNGGELWRHAPCSDRDGLALFVVRVLRGDGDDDAEEIPLLQHALLRRIPLGVIGHFVVELLQVARIHCAVVVRIVHTSPPHHLANAK